MIDVTIPRKNYTVEWTFESKVLSGSERAELLRNDCAAMTALIRQMYMSAFEKATITETHDTFVYDVKLKFHVEDPAHTTMFLIVSGMLNNKFETIAGHAWKTVYEAKSNNVGYAD